MSRLTEELVRSLVEQRYPLPQPIGEIRILDPCKALIRLEGSRLLFKRHITLRPQDVENMSIVYEASIDAGVSPGFLRTTDGKLFFQHSGQVHSVQLLIEESGEYPQGMLPHMLFQALSDFHAALDGILAAPLQSHFDRLLSDLPTQAERHGFGRHVGMVESVEARRKCCSTVVHGDLHPGNVVFSGDRLFIIDLDSAASSAPEVDMAFAAYRFFPEGDPRRKAFLQSFGINPDACGDVWKYLTYSILQRIIFILESAENGDFRWLSDLENQKRYLEHAEAMMDG